MTSTEKRAPQRSCIACRRVTAQRELVRLVRTPGLTVEIDPGGKKAGRGAYLCPAAACWQAGLKGGRLERALKITLTPDNREQLMKWGAQL